MKINFDQIYPFKQNGDLNYHKSVGQTGNNTLVKLDADLLCLSICCVQRQGQAEATLFDYCRQ